jgi:hypothetical protein
MSSKPSAGHIEATVLRAILKRHAKNPHAQSQALEAVKRPPKRVKPCSASKSAAVRLVKKSVDHATPAIWLHPAEGTAPTMHYYSWCALDRPTPTENKVCVNMDNMARLSPRRGEHCGKCVYDAWQNASLSTMAMDFAKLKLKEVEECNAGKQEAEEQKKSSVRKVFGNLRELLATESKGGKRSAQTSKASKASRRLSKENLDID